MPRRCCWLTLLFLALLPARGASCNIPVFRYALERWRPSPYEVTVFHRGTLPQASQSWLELLEGSANVSIRPIDLDDKLEPDQQELWKKHGSESALPWVVVRFPKASRLAAPLWVGPLDRQALGLLTDSPARQQLARQLTSGGSTVFVLLTSADAKETEAARELLRRELIRLEQELKLPAQSKDGPQLLSDLPLKVSLPILVVSRDDPAERLFVQMLLRGENALDDKVEDLSSVTAPIVFPIFGRGRMLVSFYGKDLIGDNLKSAAVFLCGACSCEVKEGNPGVDLLMAAGWDDLLATTSEPSPTAKPEKIAAPQVIQEESSCFLPQLNAPPPPGNFLSQQVQSPRRVLLGGAIGLAALLVLVTGFRLYRSLSRAEGVED